MNSDADDSSNNNQEQSVKGINLHSQPIVSISAKQYPVFRKYFHVPSEWMRNRDFLDLVEHRYETINHASSFNFIKERLKNLGYDDTDKKRMLHDYMYYLLADMLTAENVPFITERDMIAEPILLNLFDGKTPDLIIKSGGPNRPKPLIVDVYVGQSEKTVSEKKAKYSTMKVVFDFTSLTLLNYNTELLKVLEQSDVDYFHRQFVLFQAEYSYWHACLKFQHILFNDKVNAPIRDFPAPSPEYYFTRDQFKTKLGEKAASLVNNDDL
jgi:hypothetical protein